MSKYADALPDVLILASIDRSARHRARGPEVDTSAIYHDLDIPTRSGRARHVHRRLPILEAAGQIERSRLHGIEKWALTTAGARCLARANRAGNVPELPESRQHRVWRKAHATAEEEMAPLRKEVRGLADHSLGLLATDADSDAWFEVADSLHRSCRLLGGLVHCSREWAEPDDATPDIDDYSKPGNEENLDPEQWRKRVYLRHGRRNITRGVFSMVGD